MKDLGEPEIFLGMRIIRDRQKGTLSLKQTEYTEKILEKFNMTECKAQRTPMETTQVKNRELRSEEITQMNQKNQKQKPKHHTEKPLEVCCIWQELRDQISHLRSTIYPDDK